MSRFVTQDLRVIDAVKSYRAADAMERYSKEEKDSARQIIIPYMSEQGVEKMEAEKSLVSVSRYSTVRINTTKLKKEHPDIAKEYSEEVEVVRITVRDA